MKTKQPKANQSKKLRAIAYNMDLLIPGIYIWCPWFTLKIGDSYPDDNPYRYPGMIHNSNGVTVVVPGYAKKSVNNLFIPATSIKNCVS